MDNVLKYGKVYIESQKFQKKLWKRDKTLKPV